MIILCADDYAISQGVSRAIGELAAARRLSATSVLVNTPHWPATAPRLLAHRAHLAIGIHLNLTLGAPLGQMPRLAPAGRLPTARTLAWKALLGLVDANEVRDEFNRQLDRFERGLQFPPDHVDGHQHVHTLANIRDVLLETLSRRYGGNNLLVRDPSDHMPAIMKRRTARSKALVVNALAFGFGRAVRKRGLLTNRGFSGFSLFDETESYAAELKDALIEPGKLHIVMCHPGHVDADLARVDPVVNRRRTEYEVLMNDPDLPARIWRLSRSPDGPPVDWRKI
jgi:predicted glycoside hydrolase/deacetylase ChbG (UPF0249 family)